MTAGGSLPFQPRSSQAMAQKQLVLVRPWPGSNDIPAAGLALKQNHNGRTKFWCRAGRLDIYQGWPPNAVGSTR